MSDYHEPADELSPGTRDLQRALSSLKEELEAVNWYQQRVDVTKDAELARVLAHNRDEEKEHAAMVLEWIRRRDPIFAEKLRTYLFTEGEIAELEEQATGEAQRPDSQETPIGSRLTVGGLID